MTVQTIERSKVEIPVDAPPVELRAAPLATNLDTLLQDADARLDRADEALHTADEAQETADQAASAARVARKRSDDMTISAGLIYIELQSAAQLAGVLWKDIVARSRHGKSRIADVMKIARSSNPTRAAVEHREKNATNNKKHRENVHHEDDVMDVLQEEHVDDPYGFLSGVPSTDVHDPEPDPVNAIMVRVEALNTEQTRDLMARLTIHYQKIGLMPAPKPRVVAPTAAPDETLARAKRAAELFQALGSKRMWVAQRMDEEPRTFPTNGPDTEWLYAYWPLPAAEKTAIKQAIKIAETRSAT